MEWKIVDDGGEGRTFALVASRSDDAIQILEELAREEQISGAQLTAVGAFSRATVGWFDRSAQKYQRIEVDEQCEVLSLLGDIACSDDGPSVHVHAVLGLSTGHVRGGHLLGGEVWPTLEVIIRESSAALKKAYDSEVGLALIDLDQSA